MKPFMGIWKDGRAKVPWRDIAEWTNTDFVAHIHQHLRSISTKIFALHFCEMESRYHFFFYQEMNLTYATFDPKTETFQVIILPLYIMGRMDAFVYMVCQRIASKEQRITFDEACPALETEILDTPISLPTVVGE